MWNIRTIIITRLPRNVWQSSQRNSIKFLYRAELNENFRRCPHYSSLKQTNLPKFQSRPIHLSSPSTAPSPFSSSLEDRYQTRLIVVHPFSIHPPLPLKINATSRRAGETGSRGNEGLITRVPWNLISGKQFALPVIPQRLTVRMISGCNNIRGNERMRAWNTVVAAKNRDTGTRDKGKRRSKKREEERDGNSGDRKHG